MKKAGAISLIAVTIAFIVFIVGMVIGRSFYKSDVSVQFLSDYTVAAEAQTYVKLPVSHYTDEGLLNINTATVDELDSLPGIGFTIATRIIKFREDNGPFASISELSQVEGIGSKKLLAISELITVED